MLRLKRFDLLENVLEFIFYKRDYFDSRIFSIIFSIHTFNVYNDNIRLDKKVNQKQLTGYRIIIINFIWTKTWKVIEDYIMIQF